MPQLFSSEIYVLNTACGTKIEGLTFFDFLMNCLTIVTLTIMVIIFTSVLLSPRSLRSLTTSKWPHSSTFSIARKNCKILLPFVDEGHWGQFCSGIFWAFKWPPFCSIVQNFQIHATENTAKIVFYLRFTNEFQNGLKRLCEVRMRFFDNFRTFWLKFNQYQKKYPKNWYNIHKFRGDGRTQILTCSGKMWFTPHYLKFFLNFGVWFCQLVTNEPTDVQILVLRWIICT